MVVERLNRRRMGVDTNVYHRLMLCTDAAHVCVQSYRLGLAIVPLCRGTGALLRRTQAPPGPFEFFLIIMVTISVDRQHYRQLFNNR